MLKETEKQAKNISMINEALRLRTHRTFCISGIFILVFVIVISAIVGGLIEKHNHVSEVSNDLEKALKQSRIQGEELKDLKDDIKSALHTVISKQDSIAIEVSNIYSKVTSLPSLTGKVDTVDNVVDTILASVNTQNSWYSIYSKVSRIESTANNIKSTLDNLWFNFTFVCKK